MSCDDFLDGIPAICPTACKIAHASIYPNSVGVYPSDFLPSRRTQWFASFAANFAAAGPPDDQGVGTILGILGGGAGIAGGEFIPNLGQTINFQSYHTLIFARTANRINVAHVITQEEINSMDEGGIATIDVGEYVFEAVSVTDVRLDETTTELTEQELNQIISSGENESDRAFRKLFEISISNNRFVSIDLNVLGIEYRIDNATDKERLALDSAGRGDLRNPSYRDASSKKLKVNLKNPRINEEGEEGEVPKAGDVIYLTYIAVKEHYIRQNINASWQVFDFGSQLECITLLLNFKVQNFRFYEWQLESGESGVAERIAGWRIVESFFSRVNHVTSIGNSPLASSLGDIAIGNSGLGVQSSRYIPGLVTKEQLESFISNRNSMPITEVNHLDTFGTINFHPNSGAQGNAVAFRNSEWFQRGNFTAYDQEGDSIEHVLFNVHPKALKKRDLDKWGVERFLAVEVEKDVNSGKLTFFPFMDDPNNDDPTVGVSEFVDASNFKLEPIEPLSRFSNGNFRGCCGSLGTFTTVFQLISGGPDQNVQQRDGINSFHRVDSNIITEKFDVDTRILVERNFPQATEVGPNIVAIAGAATDGGSVTCIADPSKSYAFAVHDNDDNFMIYNSFNIGFMADSLRVLSFRPDIDSPPLIDNNNPHPSQFEPRLGFTGNLGDRPGYKPGRTITLSDFTPLDTFLYKTTNKTKFLKNNPNILDENVEEIRFTQTDKIIVPVSNLYHGRIDVLYKLPQETADDDSIIVILKNGEVVNGAIDGLTVRVAGSGLLRVDMRWLRGDTIEIVGDRVADMKVENITVVSIDADKAADFLNNTSSSSLPENRNLEFKLRDTDLFFQSSVMSVSEDTRSVLYVFFADADGGISVTSSYDFGNSWHFHYGIVEPIDGNNAESPFCVTHFDENICYLFFNMAGFIFCKKIPFENFVMGDANLIERFSSDRFEPGSETLLPKEKASIYTSKGSSLRRNVLSYTVAGQTDNIVLGLLGYNFDTGEIDPFENREVEIREPDGSITTKTSRVRKNPIARGGRSASANSRLETLFFSATRNDRGVLRMFFMGEVEDNINSDIGAGGGKSQLQCSFSNDDGRNWYDQWEYIAFGYNRLRYDSQTGQPFIDRSANGNSEAQNIEGIASEEDRNSFGINIHWSRLRRDKIQEGELSSNSESQVIEIEAPYVFYQSTTNKSFIFYVYQNTLLCKIIDDNLFTESAARRHDDSESLAGMVQVKNIIERSTRSYFVDGYLNQPELVKEIHDYYNADTDERLSDGNIVFPYQSAIEKFDDTRSIFTQRVCAHELFTGQIRVYYKHQGNNDLKSAIWTGREFWPEDFLKDKDKVGEFVPPPLQGGTKVKGGFGDEAF